MTDTTTPTPLDAIRAGYRRLAPDTRTANGLARHLTVTGLRHAELGGEGTETARLALAAAWLLAAVQGAGAARSDADALADAITTAWGSAPMWLADYAAMTGLYAPVVLQLARAEAALLADRQAVAELAARELDERRATAERALAAQADAAEILARVRELAESWTETGDGHGEPTPEMAAEAGHGRQVLALIDGTCGDCDGGLVDAGGCNCGSPADASVNFAHERLCGAEQCPNGCWEKLRPPAPEPARM